VVKGQAPLPLPGGGSLGATPNWIQMLLGGWSVQSLAISPSEARDGKDNSIVGILVNWIATSWMVAPPVVGPRDEQGKVVANPSHPLPLLLSYPSPFAEMDGAAIISAWVRDYVTKGNAYSHIVASRSGAPVALDYLPAALVSAVPDANGRLLRYDYTVNGVVRPLKPSEVLHFRNGIDETNPLLGISPLAAQYREIVTDNSYSDASASIGKNGGMNAGVFSPRITADGMMQMTSDQARELSDKYNEKRRQDPGRTNFLPGSVDYHKIGLSPAEMALNDVRAMPETRIPAALGIPAILLQLYTGIQKSTYNNLAEAIQQGWRGGIIPMMRVFESQINLKLMPLYGNGKRDVFAWDTSVVPELQDDTLALREADRADVAAGILTADEARERQGLGPKPIEATPAPTALPAVPAAKSLTAFRKVAGQTPGNIYDVADAFRRALARDEAATIDALATEWARAQRNLDKRIKELLDYISKHQETAGWRDEALKRLLTLQDQISDELSGLADRGAAIVEDGQRAAILSTTQYVEPLARAAAGAVPAGKTFPWATLSSDAFEALVGLSSDGSPLSTLLDSFAGDTGLLIRNALLDGIVKGENPRTVAQRLSVTTSVSRARLEAIARTEMLRASREATRRTYAANGDVLSGYRRLSAADSRTCVSCWALHGTLSTTAEIMPSHPQCRCVMLPNLRSWAEITGDMSIPDERETMASGAELFSMLPESDQAEILGPSRFELYRAGASLESFSATENDPQWGPTTRVKPLAEVTQ